MSDRYNNELAALLTPAPSTGVQFSQAKVLTWDNERLRNTLEWRGITLTDVPIVEGINPLVIRPGDIVGMLGWAPENAKGVGSWWILGKLSNPGEFVADLNITAKIFRLLTRDDFPLAFFGDDIGGDPLIILYYGKADERQAINVINENNVNINYAEHGNAIRVFDDGTTSVVQIRDPSGNEIFGSDGLTQTGLSRPWIPYLINPTHDADISGPTYTPATTSASFVNMWRGFNPVFHPRCAFGISITATGTPEWRIRVDPGSGLTTVASGGGSAGGIFDIPDWGSGAGPATEMEFLVQARNTGGGTTHITVDKLYGRQS